MTRHSSAQAKARKDCFNAHKYTDADGETWLTCHLCGGPIHPATQSWIAEHAVRRSVGGSDAPENVLPAHRKCAAEKDRVDISENAKGKRVSSKHFGVTRKSGFRRPDGMKYDWKEGRYRRDE